MNGIVCIAGVDLLMDYLEGVVPADVRRALDEHVAGCAKCTAFVKSYLETPRIVREATDVAIPVELQRLLRERIGLPPRS